MQAKKLTDTLSVAGQIAPVDVTAAKAAGVTTIICNRPDGEAADQPAADAIRAAAEAADIAFHHNPITPGNPTPDAVRRQGELIKDADGKVLAYCGSGQRATVLWMLANPGGLSADERIACAADAGYDLAQLRPKL